MVFTDHKPLVTIFKRNKEPTNARQTLWITNVSALKFEIKYEPGKKNVIADALSRIKYEEEKKVLTTKITNEVNNDLLSKVIKEFIEEKLIIIDGIDTLLMVIIIENLLLILMKAHSVAHKTYQRLRKSYYWNNMVNDIKRVIAKCNKCQLNKPQPYPEPQESIPTQVEGPFTHLGLDIIGPLKKTSNNNQYIIVALDYLKILSL